MRKIDEFVVSWANYLAVVGVATSNGKMSKMTPIARIILATQLWLVSFKANTRAFASAEANMIFSCWPLAKRPRPQLVRQRQGGWRRSQSSGRRQSGGVEEDQGGGGRCKGEGAGIATTRP